MPTVDFAVRSGPLKTTLETMTALMNPMTPLSRPATRAGAEKEPQALRALRGGGGASFFGVGVASSMRTSITSSRAAAGDRPHRQSPAAAFGLCGCAHRPGGLHVRQRRRHGGLSVDRKPGRKCAPARPGPGSLLGPQKKTSGPQAGARSPPPNGGERRGGGLRGVGRANWSAPAPCNPARGGVCGPGVGNTTPSPTAARAARRAARVGENGCVTGWVRGLAGADTFFYFFGKMNVDFIFHKRVGRVQECAYHLQRRLQKKSPR